MECDVLVVDDDPSIRKIVLMILEHEGYRVAAARNGAEAVEQIAQRHPKVVLLDMHMPILDGWGVVATLKQRQLGCQIVVMTASPEAKRWAREGEAVDYLVKPFPLEDLLATVERLCHAQAA